MINCAYDTLIDTQALALFGSIQHWRGEIIRKLQYLLYSCAISNQHHSKPQLLAY